MNNTFIRWTVLVILTSSHGELSKFHITYSTRTGDRISHFLLLPDFFTWIRNALMYVWYLVLFYFSRKHWELQFWGFQSLLILKLGILLFLWFIQIEFVLFSSRHWELLFWGFQSLVQLRSSLHRQFLFLLPLDLALLRLTKGLWFQQ